MSRLPAMTYREVVQRLRAAGFGFDRQAKGSHKSGITQKQNAARLYRITLATYRPAHSAPSSAKPD